jgi:bifunctional DNase/RNase
VIQVKVASLGVDAASQSPVVILQETDGPRVLPIWIGPNEASAIAMEMAGMKFARPLTHDLLASLIRELGAHLERVEISRVEENTYFAQLLLARGSEKISVDARPSDSIAVALRTSSEIWTDPKLLTNAAIGQAGEATPQDLDDASAGPSALTPEQLREYLRKLNPEDLGRFNP